MLQLIDLNVLGAGLEKAMNNYIEGRKESAYDRGDNSNVDADLLCDFVVDYIKSKAAKAVGEVETMSAGTVIHTISDGTDGARKQMWHGIERPIFED